MIVDGYALSLQKAVRAALLADADLASLISTRLYDEPPENVTYPYARFGSIVADTDDTDGSLGSVLSFTIEAYSRVTGRVEASRIVEAVRAALHRQEGTLGSLMLADRVNTGYMLQENDSVILLENGDKIVNTDIWTNPIELICNDYFVERDDAVGRGYTGRALFTAMLETSKT